jgi:hypothetical protein
MSKFSLHNVMMALISSTADVGQFSHNTLNYARSEGSPVLEPTVDWWYVGENASNVIFHYVGTTLLCNLICKIANEE